MSDREAAAGRDGLGPAATGRYGWGETNTTLLQRTDATMTDSEHEIGGASEAAELLGLSVSRFNALRLRDTHVYDPVEESLTRVNRNRGDLREHLAEKHLVAPAFAGRRPAGGRWKYNLELLREYRRRGWPGARFPNPEGIG